MGNSVIVWDIETIPDLGGYATANGLEDKSEDEIRVALGDKFPKHIYHSIICIGALVAHWEDGRWTVDALGAPHVGERPEKLLISSFVDRIAELRPQLVTFGGSSFDLPVLRYRAIPRQDYHSDPISIGTQRTRLISAMSYPRSVRKQR
jgi:predicted PolB exonuclease-like 3'-5' exonuclease